MIKLYTLSANQKIKRKLLMNIELKCSKCLCNQCEAGRNYSQCGVLLRDRALLQHSQGPGLTLVQ